MINYDSITKFFDLNTLDLQYHKVTQDVFSIEDVNSALEIIFQYHRKKGFPHYNIPKHKKLQQFKSLKRFDEKTLFKDGKIDQTMHGLSLAWTYFPHWVDVICGSSKLSPIEYWNNDDKLKEIIRKTWNWQIKHGNGSFTLNRLRQNLKIYGGNQSVSNFRPSAAKYIYNTYGNQGVVWDMSCGWGGRLLGFLSSDCKRYIGTEPSSKTFDGLERLKEDMNIQNKEVELYKLGSEVFQPEDESIDLCFTSPPYFDTEKYSDEKTQSYIKYPTEKKWINGFLKYTIENCYRSLKVGGKMMLNIANTKKYKKIEKETIRISSEMGFKHIDTIYLILSSVSGNGEKLEPIFVFEK